MILVIWVVMPTLSTVVVHTGTKWGLVYQKQVSMACISNYITQTLLVVFTYACLRYLLLAQKPSNDMTGAAKSTHENDSKCVSILASVTLIDEVNVMVCSKVTYLRTKPKSFTRTHVWRHLLKYRSIACISPPINRPWPITHFDTFEIDTFFIAILLVWKPWCATSIACS